MSFKLDDRVQWHSQANGGWTKKVGVIVDVVPAKKVPNMREIARRLNARDNYGGGGERDHESYVVAVKVGTTAKAKPVLYWPVASKLKAA